MFYHMVWILLSSTNLILCQFQPLQLPLYQVKLGFLFSIREQLNPQVGYAGSAGAVSLAVEQAKARGLLNNINLTFYWRFDNGSSGYSLGYAMDMLNEDGVHVIFGPVTPEAQTAVSAYMEYRKVPHFVWGKPSPYDSENKYNSTMLMSGSAMGSIIAVMHVCNHFNWTNIAFIYSIETTDRDYLPFCDTVAESIESGVTTFGYNVTLTYNREVLLHTVENYKRILTQASQNSRVFVLCIADDKVKRRFLLAAQQDGRTSKEYMYLIMQSAGSTYGGITPLWEDDDGQNEEAKEAFKSTLIIDKPSDWLSNEYNERVLELVKGYPWMCNECVSTDGNASSLAFYLGDSVLAYIYAINSTIEKYHTDLNFANILKNATYVLENIPDSYEDLEGDITDMYFKKTRITPYGVYGLDVQGRQQTWAFTTSLGDFSFKDAETFEENYTNAKTTIWATRGGFQPLNEPLCGFRNNKCPIEAWVLTVTVTGGSVLLVLVLLLFIGVICCYQRNRRRRLNSMWRVDFHELEVPKDTNQINTKSTRSFVTMTSQSMSIATIDNNKFDHIKFFYFNQELVVGRKAKGTIVTSAIEPELREMRMLEHPQINRFLGIAQDGQYTYALYRYCERGTIEDVINEYKDRIDQRIVHNMISQIVEGLYFLHNSQFGPMGWLCSDRCLVNERFEVKLQEVLYIAPELLRRPLITAYATKPGDIYSFAILTTQISTHSSVWSLEERNLEVEPICRRVIKRTEPLERPPLQMNNGYAIDPRLESLIIQCFEEEPTNRPDIKQVRDRVRFLDNDRQSNLMDYMFALMENTAVDLEQQVQYRTAELAEEQRRAELLLNRMMPPNVVEVLRRGETVMPEVYDSATVYFSDIVSFTALSSRSTPLQVINFLNSTYTMADDVLSRHEVYKVETIGDGLHCVSGIPVRNGNNHVREICDMALDMREGIKTVRMPHLPNEDIQIRMGIHSGPCVTGIVGITAPRYCVFGDTVNTAAKMESSGKPGYIQISCDAKELIDETFSKRYLLEERGEVLVKNHNPKLTYWLLSRSP